MKKLYIASGYNSWINKQMTRAFNKENDADKFLEGLTDPTVQVFAYKSTVDLMNIFLRA